MIPWILEFNSEPDGSGNPIDPDVGFEPVITISNDANSSIIVPPTTMTRMELGVWEYDQTGDIPGQSYTAQYTVTLEGEPINRGGWTKTSPPTAGSIYIEYNRFIRKYGLKNVTYVSNQNTPNATTPNVDVLNDAFQLADSEINNNLRGGPYIVPLTFTTYSSTIDYSVQDAAMTIAYGYMYFSRWDNSLSLDENEVAQRSQSSRLISKQIAQVYDWLSLVKSGIKQIGADPRSDGSYNLTPKTVGLYELEVARFTNWWRYGQIPSF